MEIVIVSRHAGTVEWLRRLHNRDIIEAIDNGNVMAHVTPEQVRGKRVIGVIPMELAAEAHEVCVVSMPGLRPEDRGRDLTPEEMDRAGACLRWFVVIGASCGGVH